MPQCAVLSSPCMHLIQLHTGLHVVHSSSIKFVVSFSRVIFCSIKDLLMLVIQEVCFSPSLLCPDLSHSTHSPSITPLPPNCIPSETFPACQQQTLGACSHTAACIPPFPPFSAKPVHPGHLLQTAEVTRSQKSLHFDGNTLCSAKIMSNTEEMSVFRFLFSSAGVIHVTQMPVQGCALCMCSLSSSEPRMA